MKSIFSHVLLVFFVMLCSLVVYENTANLFNENKKPIVAMRSLDKNNALRETTAKEMDYFKLFDHAGH